MRRVLLGLVAFLTAVSLAYAATAVNFKKDSTNPFQGTLTFVNGAGQPVFAFTDTGEFRFYDLTTGRYLAVKVALPASNVSQLWPLSGGGTPGPAGPQGPVGATGPAGTCTCPATVPYAGAACLPGSFIQSLDAAGKPTCAP